MDPNETLKQIRQNIERNTVDGDNMAVVLFAQLDEWLQKGGFLPDDWAPKHSDSCKGVNRCAACRRDFLKAHIATI